jgi:glycosyltransferase involved in cell wall biosynthesis
VVQTRRDRYVFLLPWALRSGSGVNAVVFGLAEAMRDHYDPVFVNTGWDAPAPGQIWLKLPVPAPGLRDMLGFLARLGPNLVRLRSLTQGAVAVNPHFVGLELLPLALLRRLRLCPKLILSVHGADMAEAADSSGWTRALFTWMLSSADLVVACSHALADHVRLFSPRARVVAVWNAVADRPDSPPSRPIESRYVICVAHFVKKKAHDVLLRAFHLVAKERADLRLVLIGGEGPERPAVMSLIDSLGRADKVDVMVNVSHGETWRWIWHAECLILPSRDEPFGIVLLEAGAARTPVVATRVGGVPEFVADKIHGLLCEPDRPDEIAQAVLTTLSHPASTEERTRSFREHAQAFTWQRAFARYRSRAELP